MTSANERIERKGRLLEQLHPEHEVELNSRFVNHLAVVIRASSPNERQQALDKAIGAIENALNGVLYEI